MADVFNSSKEDPATNQQPTTPTELGGEISKSAISQDEDNIDKIFVPGHTHRALTSYCYFPHNINFIDKDPEEKVILLLRRHPVTNIGWIAVVLVMVIAPAFISVLTPFELLPPAFQIMAALIWYLLTMAFALEKFLDWFFNVDLITNERVIDVDFVNLIYREMSDAEFNKIQDVTVEVGGGIRTILNYGNIVIQTAAEISKIEFEAIPRPDIVAKVLRELRLSDEVKVSV